MAVALPYHSVYESRLNMLVPPCHTPAPALNMYCANNDKGAQHDRNKISIVSESLGCSLPWQEGIEVVEVGGGSGGWRRE